MLTTVESLHLRAPFVSAQAGACHGIARARGIYASYVDIQTRGRHLSTKAQPKLARLIKQLEGKRVEENEIILGNSELDFGHFATLGWASARCRAELNPA
jgi:hypothetical protein